MDNILSFFVRQKKLALVFSVGIIALGLLSLNSINRNQFPEVDLEIMTIKTVYQNASPEDVEQQITNPIEDELGNISGIDKFTSVSRESYSNIVVFLSQDESDMAGLKQEVTNAVNRVKTLPKEVVDLPSVRNKKASRKTVLRKSILNISIRSENYTYVQLREIIDNITDSIKLIDGVSEVIKDGYLDSEIQVRINPEKLHQYQLSLPHVIDAISKRNQRFTAGQNNSQTDEKIIVVLAKFDNIQLVSQMVLKSNFDGPVVRLKDIASIEYGNVKQKSITRVDGKKSFILRVSKQEKADLISTIDLVKENMLKINQAYDNKLQISYSSDFSKYVRNRLNIVTTNGIVGLFLVLIILSIFLSFKTALWVSISLLVSLLGVIALLFVMGETINLVSMAAMILILGIVVDDSIIVAESIHHYKQLGQDKIHAAVNGFKRVIAPVITTIITTILAFSSMFLMQGIIGKFIYVIPLVVIFALTLSLLEVSFALPAHLADVNEKAKTNTWFNSIEYWFVGFLSTVLKWRYLVVVTFVLLLAYSLYFVQNYMRFSLFPVVGTDIINVKLDTPTGSSLEHTELASIQVEKMITNVVKDDLESINTTIGEYFTNQASIVIELIPSTSSDRKKTAKVLLQDLKAKAKEITLVKKLEFSLLRPGPPQGEDIEINLISENNVQRLAAANYLEKILGTTHGVSNVNRDDKLGKTRVEVVFDFEKMARLQVNLATVNQYLRAIFTGIDATDIRKGQKDVNFRVYLGENQSEAFIDTVKVANQKGYLVPISQFSKIRIIQGEPDFNHFNGQRSIMLSASVDEDKISIQQVMNKALEQLNLANSFPKVRAISEGGGKDTIESMNNFKKAFLISLVGIFLLLVILFNSYSQSILVMITIPFSVIGVIWAFFLHGEMLSFFAILGTLALIGVIINDSLVLISHLNYLKQTMVNKTPAYEWIIQGTKDRLRAVVLTTLTTLAGLMPLAYGIGGVDFVLRPMALSLGYGLFFSTLMTLILLPCLYLINYEFVSWVKRCVNFMSKKIVAK